MEVEDGDGGGEERFAISKITSGKVPVQANNN
jgi:hypothetical protein